MIRILVGFLVFFTTTISFILRVNFNIALVTMTDMSNMTRIDYCGNKDYYNPFVGYDTVVVLIKEIDIFSLINILAVSLWMGELPKLLI